MAKKKRSKGRRRRVGGSMLNPSSPVVKIAATAAGYLLGDTINDAVDKGLASVIKTTSTDAAEIKKTADTLDTAKTVVMVAEAGAGAYLLFGPGKSSMVKSIAGGVLLGAGAKRGMKKYGVIKGYQSMPVVGGRRRVNGYQDTPVIGRATPGMGPGQLQGAPDQLQGFIPQGSGVNGYNSQGSGVMGALYMDASNGDGSGINASDR